MPTASNHDVAAHTNGKLVLAVCNQSFKEDIKGVARVFDLAEKRQLAEFVVRHECPGLGARLALGRSGEVCFVGCYQVYGIGAYSIPEGREIWRRKDLKTVQFVDTLDRQDLVFCGREKGGSHLLNAKTGATVEKFSGVKELFASPYDETVVVLGRSLEIQRPLGTTLKKLKITDKFSGFCCFTPAEIVLVDQELIQCFDSASLELLWSFVPPLKIRFRGDLRFVESLDCLPMFQRTENGFQIFRLDRRTGGILGKFQLPVGANGVFCLHGQALFKGNLCCFSAETGLLLHDFTTAEILSKDHVYKSQQLLSLAEKATSAVELEKYLRAEGFPQIDINKAVFAKMYRDEMAKRGKL